MKKIKAMLSLFMVTLVVLVSTLPALANGIDYASRVVISEDLAEVIDKCEDNEKIKVYLWYKDIDQEKVDSLTTKATGLTLESCVVVEEFPSNELLYSLHNGDARANSKMETYLKRTETVRCRERELSETYSKKHMEISNELYNQKSSNILNSLSISSNDVEFSSQFAPMIIVEMTKVEIENAAKNPNIDEISLYVETEMIEETVDSVLKTTRISSINSGTCFGLSGEDVKVGIIENDRVIFSTDGEEELSELIQNMRDEDKEIDINTLDRISVEQSVPTIIYTDNGGMIRDYGNVAVVDGTPNPGGTHSTAVSKIVLSEAPNAKIYCTNYSYINIETLISAGVKIFNLSLGGGVLEQNKKYNYTDREKWFDYIIANHGVTVCKSAGNNGDNLEDRFYIDSEGVRHQEYAPRVTSPGMAYNIITVGAYRDGESMGIDVSDSFCNYSSYKNAVGNKYGCEKPDVVMPDSMYIENAKGSYGTSYSSPSLVGMISLMCELKPSLINSPHLLKAIVLASCHRKIPQNTMQGGQETMEQGISERQGAGAPDAWTMACIVCQGTYGYGVLSDTETKVNIVQPPYGAGNMNLSVSWLKENYVEDTTLQHVEADDVIIAPTPNIDLSMYNSDVLLKTSELDYSSTEMCYLPLSQTDFNYQLRLTQDTPAIATRYAYAWSTDDMYAPITNNQDSVYYIKNLEGNEYLTYDASSNIPNVMQSEVSTQSEYNDTHKWVIRAKENAYSISAGCATTELYLGQSDILGGGSYNSQLSSVEQNINILYNEDGSVSFLNSTNDAILTYSDSSLVWDLYSDNESSLPQKYRWFLEKVNYLYGDVNLNGSLEFSEYSDEGEEGTIVSHGLDQTMIQEYLAGSTELNNLQLFLADINKDGIVNVFDISLINLFAIIKYY